MKILLIGNPNVGKSVLFSKLTGTNVTASNYPGTTVEYIEGYMKYRGEIINIIDVPGTYTLIPSNEAEKVAVDMLDKGDLVLNVLDATNLERNLNLTMQLLEKEITVIIVLNFWDEAQQKGINIDVEKLTEKLKVPVIPTAAIKGQGLKDLISNFQYQDIVQHSYSSVEKKWSKIGEIIEDVQEIKERKPSKLEKFEDMTLRYLTGLPIMFVFLFLSFVVIRFLGEGIIEYITEPFFQFIYKPIITSVSLILGEQGFIHNLLIGQLIEGNIDFEQSFGLLSTGVFIPIAAVLPYIIAFYFVLGILEDTGYLPRMAVLVDNVMHKVGLHGFSIIPMILGFGCNVPAALSIRSLESKREKFIASTLMAIAIPCMAQIAMIIGLLASYGGQYIVYVFLILALIWVIVGLVLNKLLPGFSSELLLEVPPFRIPSILTILKKLWMRMISFLKDALPYMLLGVFVVNLLYGLGVFAFLAKGLGPILYIIFGLPQEAVSALLMGFLRKDLAMGLLIPLNLSVQQLVVASTILVIYFPCVATFVVLIRELGMINMIKASILMLVTTTIVGGFVNLTFQEGSLSLIGGLIIMIILLSLQYIPKVKSKKNNNMKI